MYIISLPIYIKYHFLRSIYIYPLLHINSLGLLSFSLSTLYHFHLLRTTSLGSIYYLPSQYIISLSRYRFSFSLYISFPSGPYHFPLPTIISLGSIIMFPSALYVLYILLPSPHDSSPTTRNYTHMLGGIVAKIKD